MFTSSDLQWATIFSDVFGTVVITILDARPSGTLLVAQVPWPDTLGQGAGWRTNHLDFL